MCLELFTICQLLKNAQLQFSRTQVRLPKGFTNAVKKYLLFAFRTLFREANVLCKMRWNHCLLVV